MAELDTAKPKATFERSDSDGNKAHGEPVREVSPLNTLEIVRPSGNTDVPTSTRDRGVTFEGWLKSGSSPDTLLKQPDLFVQWSRDGHDLSTRHPEFDFEKYFKEDVAPKFKEHLSSAKALANPDTSSKEPKESDRDPLLGLLRTAANIREFSPEWASHLISNKDYLDLASQTFGPIEQWMRHLTAGERGEAIDWVATNALKQGQRGLIDFLPSITDLSARQKYLDLQAQTHRLGGGGQSLGRAVEGLNETDTRSLLDTHLKIFPEPEFALAEAVRSLPTAIIDENADKLFVSSEVASTALSNLRPLIEGHRQGASTPDSDASLKRLAERLDTFLAERVHEDLKNGTPISSLSLTPKVMISAANELLAGNLGVADMASEELTTVFKNKSNWELSDDQWQTLTALKTGLESRLRDDLRTKLLAGEYPGQPAKLNLMLSSDKPEDRILYVHAQVGKGKLPEGEQLTQMFDGLTEAGQKQVFSDLMLSARGGMREDFVHALYESGVDNRFPSLAPSLEQMKTDSAVLPLPEGWSSRLAVPSVQLGADFNWQELSADKQRMQSEDATIKLPHLKPGVVVPPQGLNFDSQRLYAELVDTPATIYTLDNGVQLRVPKAYEPALEETREKRRQVQAGQLPESALDGENNVLPEDVYKLATKVLPQTGLLKTITLFGEESPAANFYRMDERGNVYRGSPVASADSYDGSMTIYSKAKIGDWQNDFSDTVKHEWAHLPKKADYSFVYSIAHDLERDRWSRERYATTNVEEDMAVHIGEAFMSQHPQNLAELIKNMPSKALAAAAILDNALSRSTAVQSDQNEALARRVEFAREYASNAFAGDLSVAIRHGDTNEIDRHLRYLQVMNYESGTNRASWSAAILRDPRVAASINDSLPKLRTPELIAGINRVFTEVGLASDEPLSKAWKALTTDNMPQK